MNCASCRAKLAVSNEYLAAQFSGIGPTLDAVTNRIFNPDISDAIADAAGRCMHPTLSRPALLDSWAAWRSRTR